MDDATLHGCIPVIIMDEVDVSFESIIDLSAFTVRIPQADAEKLPEILLAISEERRDEMRRNMAKVWHRWVCGGRGGQSAGGGRRMVGGGNSGELSTCGVVS